jgi:hypothetical protein
MSDNLAVVEPSLPAKTSEAQSNKLTRLAAFTPTNLTEAVALAKLIASSELAPKDYRGKPGNVLIAMQLGAELGVAPMQAIQNVAVINGRPSVWGDLALALVQSHPDYESHKEFMEGSGDNRKAVFQIRRKGQEWHQQTFSVQDAKVAGLWGKVGPWKTNPDRMLQMRARGFGLRDKFADALKGLRLAEEAMDMPADKPTRDVGTLDVNREISTMTASSEPNRGHGNEGLVQQPDLSTGPGIDQTRKTPENVICSDCGKTNTHDPSCKYAQQCPECHGPGGKHATKCSLNTPKNPDSSPVASEKASEPPQSTPETKELKAGQEKMLLRVLSTEEWSKGNLAKLNVAVEDSEMNEWTLGCWDKKLWDALKGATGQNCVFVTEKAEKNGRTFYNLVDILAIGATEFTK